MSLSNEKHRWKTVWRRKDILYSWEGWKREDVYIKPDVFHLSFAMPYKIEEGVLFNHTVYQHYITMMILYNNHQPLFISNYLTQQTPRGFTRSVKLAYIVILILVIFLMCFCKQSKSCVLRRETCSWSQSSFISVSSWNVEHRVHEQEAKNSICSLEELIFPNRSHKNTAGSFEYESVHRAGEVYTLLWIQLECCEAKLV